MNTYITKVVVDGQAWAGPRIQADSFEEALAKTAALPGEVLGQLDSEHLQEPA